MRLEELGWTPSINAQFESYRASGFIPARVSQEHKGRYLILCELGERTGEITGRLRYMAESKLDFPAVGDWVAVQADSRDPLAVIHSVLPRKTVFLRKTAGQLTEPQVVAANIDVLFLVTDLGQDFNIRRAERYLTLVYESGASPVIVLNKADLCPEPEALLNEMASVALGAPIHLVSAIDGSGVDALRTYADAGRTIAFLGSSGVGKSTLINRLLGEERQKTKAIREDDGRGRHTTTARQLILLPGGGLVIDTPGMREIQLWGEEADLASAFEDVEDLVRGCRFSDCRHSCEPGCAVRPALEDGRLDRGRWDSYRKLQREMRFLERRQNVRSALEEKARWKRIHRAARENERLKRGRF